MLRFIKKASKPAGASPGTLALVDEQRTDPVRIRLMDYDPSRLDEQELDTIEDALPLKELPSVSWINIDGIHDLGLIERIGSHFDIHGLTLEDVVNTSHRPKFEEFDNYIFLVFKMLSYDAAQMHIRSEQISLIVGPRCVISFQETASDVFDPIRMRIRKEKGRLRNRGCGYLAYALIDAVVDHYFAVLEAIGEKIEAREAELMGEPGEDTLTAIHRLKQEIIFFRKQVWPMREIVSSLNRGESELIYIGNEAYLADVYENTVQVLDTVESFRDVLSSMVDLYMSTVSNRMNEVMKVLTMIATIFIPLTFVAGIYGMNFKFMPELEWQWGYFAVWGIMAVITITMVAYFKRKKWL